MHFYWYKYYKYIGPARRELRWCEWSASKPSLLFQNERLVSRVWARQFSITTIVNLNLQKKAFFCNFEVHNAFHKCIKITPLPSSYHVSCLLSQHLPFPFHQPNQYYPLLTQPLPSLLQSVLPDAQTNIPPRWTTECCRSYMYMNLVGRVSKFIHRLTWDAVLQNDLLVKGLNRITAFDWLAGRNATRWIRFTHSCLYWAFQNRCMDYPCRWDTKNNIFWHILTGGMGFFVVPICSDKCRVKYYRR